MNTRNNPMLRRSMVFAGVCLAGLVIATSTEAAMVPVYNTNDDLAGSLRQAIQDASPGDTIVFHIPTSDMGYDYAANVWTISLTSGALQTAKNLTIDGAGSKIIVRRSGAQNFQIFKFPIGGGPVTLANLTLRDGTGDFGGSGGAISNDGILTVRNCTLVNNRADAYGSAIFNFGTLTMMNSTVTGNTSGGAAIENAGDATITNSTIYGNTGTARPCGGVSNESGRTARIRNTIIAGNNAGASPNVEGDFVSEGYNLIGVGTGGFGFNATGDQVGASVAQINLGILADNGGLTQTLIPGGGSVAIDQGKRGLDANGQPINIDQRGSPRPVDMPGVNNAIGGDGSDIGAVELGLPQPGPTFAVTSTAGHSNGGCTADDCTLREALDASNANPDANVINFAAGVAGYIAPPASAGFSITNPVTINGPGAKTIIINGGGVNRLFTVSSSNVAISGLYLFNGFANTLGGGCNVSAGGLTLTDCAVVNNFVPGTGGGGLYVASGATVTLNRSALYGNTTIGLGGAIYSQGTVTATNCTISANTARNGGGIFSEFNSGNSRLTLKNCTITQCQASDTATADGSGGGGVYAVGAIVNGVGQYHLGNTLVAGNTSASIPQTNPDVRGNFISDGHNFIGNKGNSTFFTTGVTGDQIGTNAAPLDPMLDQALIDNGGPTNTHALLAGSTAINAGDDALAPPTDQRGYSRNGLSDIGAFEFAGLPTGLANLSTRIRVETGDDVLIGGFIVSGIQPKRVIIRGIGPSLNVNGMPLPGRLPDTTLELVGPSGTIAMNDNWRTGGQEAEIIASTVPPPSDLESAIVATLPANSAAYTAIVRGKNGGTGVGLVELYDLDRAALSKLVNISTRGRVQTGDDVMIGGFFILGANSQRVVVRALGPSVPVSGRLADPTLELIDGNGTLLASNDNWRSTQQAEIIATTVPPTNDLESALVASLPPAPYTVIVRGKNNTTGVALVEVYALP